MLMIDSLLRHLSQDEIQARNLTKPSDKLPALDGIAQQLSRRRPNVQYLAGLWSDTLAQDMLWEINTRGTGKPYSSGLGQPWKTPFYSLPMHSSPKNWFRFLNAHANMLTVTHLTKYALGNSGLWDNSSMLGRHFQQKQVIYQMVWHITDRKSQTPSRCKLEP
ncbi:hypothetical protein N431DRAFT_560127 [Stipitochalara longipes BDJ]|nr:hypothetical protein N431DRAFT_560127 [Stipitochalara longipes BDJ]